MTERSKKLIRQFKRYLGFENAEERIQILSEDIQAGRQASNEEDVVKLLKNFPSFFETVENAYAEYEDRLKISARNIEISSKELTTAFRDLENLNVSINAMLESLGQALLFFDKNGCCSSVHSKACLSILGLSPAEKYLPDVLNFSEEEKENFASWLNIIFSDETALNFDDMKALLPQEMINTQDHIIELDYKPMYTAGDKLEGILLIATDVTHEREAEKQLQEIQINAQKIQKIAQNRNGFHGFVTDMTSFLTLAKSSSFENMSTNDKENLLRDLHTFKGLAATFSLITLSQAIHDLESTLRKEQENSNSEAPLKAGLTKIEETLEQQKHLARSLFGADFFTMGRVKTLQISQIENLIDLAVPLLKNKEDKKRIQKFVNTELLSIPIFEAFLPFERELTRIAEQQGKTIPQCMVQGDNVPILPANYEEFFNVLIHLARNIADHGLEMPKDRTAKNKPEAGQVLVEIHKSLNDDEPETLIISISDDGKGIDPSIIRQKLAEDKNIDTSHESDEEVIQHIFDANFSSKDNASMISGHGIGMNALQATIHKMSGKIDVESDPNGQTGTKFTFEIPYKI